MPRLGTADGRKAVFPLPPFEEQRRISQHISKIFIEIDNISNMLPMSEQPLSKSGCTYQVTILSTSACCSLAVRRK